MTEVAPDPATSPKESPLKQEISRVVRSWPPWFAKLIKNAPQTLRDLPISGPWSEPLILSAAAGLVGGIVNAVIVLRFSVSLAMGGIIGGTIGSTVGVFIGSFVASLILGVMGKDPGYYRTALLGARLAILGPVGLM